MQVDTGYLYTRKNRMQHEIVRTPESFIQKLLYYEQRNRCEIPSYS
jgi:hypothetical protein